MHIDISMYNRRIIACIVLYSLVHTTIEAYRMPSMRGSSTTLLKSQSTSPSLDNIDVLIVGLGVGGHAAALHAHSLGMKVAVATGGDPGGTCVNRGCIPSKALLAGAKRAKMLRHKEEMHKMGIQIEGQVHLDAKQLGQYATNIASQVRSGLEKSIQARGIPMIPENAEIVGPNTVKLSQSNREIKANNIILAPGSTPFVPPGVQFDSEQKRVFTSDQAVSMPCAPSYVCIVGSGYIGLEFMQVFNAMGSEVTLIEAGERMLPGLDKDISKLAERILLNTYKERPVKLHTQTLASKITPPSDPSYPLEIELMCTQTKKVKDTLKPDAVLIATGRKPNTMNLGIEKLGVQLRRGGFIPVDEHMQVLKDENSKETIPGLYCIGDANGIMMLAHAASAQAIAAIEKIAGRKRTVNPKHIPAACFTSPEIAFVGYTEDEAIELAKNNNFELGKVVSHFRANSKAVAEGEPEGMFKVLFNKSNGQVLGCHMIGMHASDLIQECANAMHANTPVQQLAFMVHTHPTLSEVVDTAWKAAVGIHTH